MAGLIVCFAVSSGLARLVARGSPPVPRARIVLGTGLGSILLVIVLAATTIFRPLAAPALLVLV